jgi:hypothetical protein
VGGGGANLGDCFDVVFGGGGGGFDDHHLQQQRHLHNHHDNNVNHNQNFNPNHNHAHNYSDVSCITRHHCRLVTSIKHQVIAVSLAPTFTAAMCNQSEAAAGRYSASVMYTSGVKRRESRAQLARALAARAMIAKDRYCVTCGV